MKKKLICVVGILLLIIGVLIVTAISSRVPARTIYVDGDDTTDSVITKMDGGCVARVLCRVLKYHPRTGKYVVAEGGENTFVVFRRLRNGQQTPVNLTIPQVRTMDRLAGYLADRLMMDSAQVAQSFADPAFCQRYGYTVQTLPALFIPNTYQVWWDITLDGFMQRMQKENKNFWTEERVSKAQKAGFTNEEIVTLASIVDEETANNAEKPMVAGMYIRRLQVGMPLQADPTVKFAVGDFSLRRIYHKHLEVESPYNTYRNTGLPPGPIRIPSIAGIDAVLNYVHHDYIYMCAKEDFSGSHNFARTYAEHLQNARKYTQALNQRNIK